MRSVTVTADGDLIIPKEILERRGLKPGDQVHIFDFGPNGRITLLPFSNDPTFGFGMLRGGQPMAALLEEKRRELEEEERDLLPPVNNR